MMRSIRTASRRAAAITGATLALLAIGAAQRTPAAPATPATPLSDDQACQRLDALMQRLVAADAFSGTVTLARDGKPLYAKAFGLANRSPRAPNTLQTRFNLGSITKMFTAVAIAQLVEHGRVAYTDPIGKLLPHYPNRAVADRVTIHHLLSHTSGMIGAEQAAQEFPTPLDARTIDAMLAPVRDRPLSFAPGARMQDSDAGFVLLGAVIERISGQTYFDYVENHVFKPAGMTGVEFVDLDAEPANVASGFQDHDGGPRLCNVFDVGVKGSPAGGAYATGADLVRFHRALAVGKLVSYQSLPILWTGVTENDRHAEYGYGFQIERYNGHRFVGHGGGRAGVANWFEMYPELGYTVVILGNIDCDPSAISKKLRGWLTQGQGATDPAPRVPPASPRRT